MRATTLLCVSAFVALWSGCSRSPVAAEPGDMSGGPTIQGDNITFPTNAPQIQYVVMEPAEKQTAVTTRLNGRLAWDDDVTSRVFSPISGRTVDILANPGQFVSAGDVLAKIRSPEFGQAQADASKAAAELKAAERTLHRARELLAHGAVAQRDVEAAETDYARALSEEQRARATLSLYGGDGHAVDALFSLKAPISGVVVEKTISPGQEVRSDQVADKPLFVISDPTQLWLFLDVAETDAAALSPGQDVVVRTRALPDDVFHGRIGVIGEGLEATTRTLKVRCTMDNSAKLLRAEMYVTATITSPTAGVVISSKAVLLRHDQHYVFVETSPATFQRRLVQLGLEASGHSAVVDGLAVGERVVTEGCLLLDSLLEG